MTLTFYNCKAPNNKITKGSFLDYKTSVTGVRLKDDTSVLHPTFILKRNANIINSNYFYCDETKRYYFFDKNTITEMTGGRISITGNCDVLYSWASELLKSTALVSISATDLNTEQQLTEQPLYFRNDFVTKSINFPNVCFDEPTTGNILLILEP